MCKIYSLHIKILYLREGSDLDIVLASTERSGVHRGHSDINTSDSPVNTSTGLVDESGKGLCGLVLGSSENIHGTLLKINIWGGRNLEPSSLLRCNSKISTDHVSLGSKSAVAVGVDEPVVDNGLHGLAVSVESGHVSNGDHVGNTRVLILDTRLLEGLLDNLLGSTRTTCARSAVALSHLSHSERIGRNREVLLFRHLVVNVSPVLSTVCTGRKGGLVGPRDSIELTLGSSSPGISNGANDLSGPRRVNKSLATDNLCSIEIRDCKDSDNHSNQRACELSVEHLFIAKRKLKIKIFIYQNYQYSLKKI